MARSRKLSEVDVLDYDAVVFPGGLGPMMDIAVDPEVKRVVARAWDAGQIVAAVCHGPAAFLGVTLADGTQLIQNRKLTSFSHEEEAGYAQADVPFLLEDALHGGGAFLNGEKLQVSSKQDLRAALVSTGQATPGEDAGTLERIGSSITAMLKTTLLVKAAVPATMQLIDVAAGRIDAFWQPGNVLSGQVAGALLVREAGGLVTDWDDANWELNSPHFLAATPGVQTAIVQVLRQLA